MKANTFRNFAFLAIGMAASANAVAYNFRGNIQSVTLDKNGIPSFKLKNIQFMNSAGVYVANTSIKFKGLSPEQMALHVYSAKTNADWKRLELSHFLAAATTGALVTLSFDEATNCNSTTKECDIGAFLTTY